MKTTTLFYIGVLLTVLLSGCKKTIDKQKENYVVGIMTNGQWFLESYVENGIDYTVDFKEYEFQFFENGRLDAISIDAIPNPIIKTGAWAGDLNSLTLVVNFPLSEQLLKRLNHVWQFLKSNIGLVFAETNTPSGKITIRLRRK